LAEDIKDEVSKLTGVAAKTTNNAGGMSIQYQNLGVIHTTYTEVLKIQLPTTHLGMISRTQFKERQVLINKDPSVDTSQLQDLTEHELLAKANKALMTMAY